MKKHSLTIEIWKYLAIFSFLILAFLWIFQILFLNSYYEWVKKKEISEVATTLFESKNSIYFAKIIDNLSYDKSLCIEVTDKNVELLSGSSIISRGCYMGNNYPNSNGYKLNFILSNKDHQTYELTNPRFHNKTLSYALRLDNNRYAFINTSLDPMDSTTKILKNQLIYVTIIVFSLSFVSAYFISKHISNPIVQINKEAKKLAKGIYKNDFPINANINEIQELATTLDHTSYELQKTENLRRDLLANISHDLKTPLTMIKAYAELNRDLNPKRKKMEENMDVITEEVDRLTLLVNDILELSKIQANVDDLRFEDFDLTELIQTIIKRFSIFQEKKGYQFYFSTTKSIWIEADKKRMEQVIYNLIINAINYTGNDKKITIELEEENHEVMVKIIDTGRGINAKEIPYIWDKYYTNSHRHQREAIGTGLGLSIVKNILQKHHFTYGVQSIKNKGTTFYFVVPIKESTPTFSDDQM